MYFLPTLSVGLTSGAMIMCKKISIVVMTKYTWSEHETKRQEHIYFAVWT